MLQSPFLAAAGAIDTTDDSDDKDMQILVSGLQKMLCLQVLSSDTISTIEALVQNKEDISRSKFHVKFKGTKLEDGSRTLADLEITNEATLQMVLMIDAECDDNYHSHHKIVINASVMGLRGSGKRKIGSIAGDTKEQRVRASAVGW